MRWVLFRKLWSLSCRHPLAKLGEKLLDIAGLRDLLAMKLKVVADRGELRDYFDLLAIEEHTEFKAEDGLRFFVERYRPRVPRHRQPEIGKIMELRPPL